MAIRFTDIGDAPTKNFLNEKGAKEELVIYQGADDVVGEVDVTPSKKLDHYGIKIELLGKIEYSSGSSYEFTSLVRELATPGQLTKKQTYPFAFKSVDKPYESYDGLNVRLRYFLRVTVSRQYASNITKEQEFIVQHLGEAPEINHSIKMEVGIEECLHIEFEYNKSKYHLNDIVIGKVYFLLVRIKIKQMEIAIIKRESAGTGSSMVNDSQTVTKFEIMDGAPVKGESIPVRLFLENHANTLTPTFNNVNNQFSAKYYLNLVLIDQEDRRYFKQQEIKMWRKVIG